MYNDGAGSQTAANPTTGGADTGAGLCVDFRGRGHDPDAVLRSVHSVVEPADGDEEHVFLEGIFNHTPCHTGKSRV